MIKNRKPINIYKFIMRHTINFNPFLNQNHNKLAKIKDLQYNPLKTAVYVIPPLQAPNILHPVKKKNKIRKSQWYLSHRDGSPLGEICLKPERRLFYENGSKKPTKDANCIGSHACQNIDRRAVQQVQDCTIPIL